MSAVTLRLVADRAARRLLDAPRVGPDEVGLGPALDALGGEIVRIRSRDGLRLSARWLPAEAGDATDWACARPARGDPAPPRLHGLGRARSRRVRPVPASTAGVLGLDFRGHGESDDAPTTFGLREVEDVAGALAWLGARGHPVGRARRDSMGGITAIASVAVLGDGSLASADDGPTRRPAHVPAPRRPRIVAVVARFGGARVRWSRSLRACRGLARTLLARRLFDAATRTPGRRPTRHRSHPCHRPASTRSRCCSSTARPTRPSRSPTAVAWPPRPGPRAEHWVVPGADHSRAHATDPPRYEARVTTFLRDALASVRTEAPIIGAPGSDTDPDDHGPGDPTPTIQRTRWRTDGQDPHRR